MLGVNDHHLKGKKMKDERDITIRRQELAEDILRFWNHYPLAKLLAFYCWATEEDAHGRMRKEREKTWSTGRRLVLFTTKAPLPEGWQEMFPEFAKAAQSLFEASPSNLTPGPSPMGEGRYRANGANGRMGTAQPGKPGDSPTPALPRREGVAAIPEGQWRLLSIDKKTLWEAMQAARAEVSEMEYKHWIEPAACAEMVNGKRLVVRYYGAGYRGQNPMQAQAFLKLTKHLRGKFPGKIDGIEAEWG